MSNRLKLSSLLVLAFTLVIAVPSLTQATQSVKNGCEGGAQLARNKDYQAALLKWKEPLSPNISYKLWRNEVLRCLISMGIVGSDKELIAWFRSAHESGSVDGTVQYAMLIILGAYREPNINKGLELLESAASRGHAHATLLLSELPENCPDYAACERELSGSYSQFKTESGIFGPPGHFPRE